MHLFNPTELATPAFIFLVLAEMLYVWFSNRGRFEARDMLGRVWNATDRP